MTSTRSEDSDDDNATLWARIKAARVRLSSETDFYRNYGLPVGSQPEANTEEHQASSRDSEGEPPKDPTISASDEPREEKPETCLAESEANVPEIPIISASDETGEKKPETCPAESEADVPEIPTISASDKASEGKPETCPAESEANTPEIPTISTPDEASEEKPETCPAESEGSVPEIPTITTSDEISYKHPEPCSLNSEAEPNDVPTITAPAEESEKQPETCSAGSECLPSPPATLTLQDTLSVAGLDQTQSQPQEVGSAQASATQESVPLQSIPSTKTEGPDLEPQPASRMADSDDSDVVMLRPRNQNSSSQNQENIRPTGTEPGKHKKTHSQRLNGRNGKRNALSDKITDGPSNIPVEHISPAGNTGQEDLTSQPRSSYKVAPPEVQEELKKLQEEALAKAIERRFEAVLNSNPETLNVVREGPGTNHESEEFLRIAAFRTIDVPGNRPESSNALSSRFRFPQDVSDSDRKKLQWSFYSRDTPAYPTFDKDGKFMISTEPTAECEGRSALLASYDEGSSVGLKQPPQPPRDFPEEIWDGMPADWLFRPSHSETNLETYRQWFWRWLDSTVALAYPVDIYHEAFFDGTAHTDGERGLFIPDIESHETKIDMTDEETRLHYNETGTGYIINYRLHLLKEAEEKGARIRRERGVYLESCLDHGEPNPYVPKANIYLRPAENRDVPGLLELCNWYIENTALCADLETLTRAEMTQRIADCKQEKLPFIVAVERNSRHALDHRERVLGYALATDYMGQTTAGQHTVELEVFVSHGSKRLGVARCLMDKLLQVCDPTYVPHLGYFFDSDLDDRPGYECGGRRMLARLIFTYCFSEDDKTEYERVKEWLKGEYNFHEQGLLRGVCVKFGKWHDVSYLVRNVANFRP
ncbi:hypothetical protein DTO271G3_3748 [Paecilomyces variotii]|nr:hypothetical protein DTO271G3_3748 [Paecilomyces variotii]